MTTANVGMGACHMGSSPLGFGTPATTTTVVAPLLIQADGTQGDCAALNTQTGDFILDANGNKVGWSSLNQMVYMALFTTKGSSAVADMGVLWPTGTIRGDLIAKNRQAVAAALKPLTDAKLITLLGVQTTRLGPTSVRRTVFWQPVNSSGPVQQTSI